MRCSYHFTFPVENHTPKCPACKYVHFTGAIADPDEALYAARREALERATNAKKEDVSSAVAAAAAAPAPDTKRSSTPPPLAEEDAEIAAVAAAAAVAEPVPQLSIRRRLNIPLGDVQDLIVPETPTAEDMLAPLPPFEYHLQMPPTIKLNASMPATSDAVAPPAAAAAAPDEPQAGRNRAWTPVMDHMLAALFAHGFSLEDQAAFMNRSKLFILKKGDEPQLRLPITIPPFSDENEHLICTCSHTFMKNEKGKLRCPNCNRLATIEHDAVSPRVMATTADPTAASSDTKMEPVPSSSSPAKPNFDSAECGFNYRKSRFLPVEFKADPIEVHKWSSFPIAAGLIPNTNGQAAMCTYTCGTDVERSLQIKIFDRDHDKGLHIDGVLAMMRSWLTMLKKSPERKDADTCLDMVVRMLDQHALKTHGYEDSPMEKAYKPPVFNCTRDEWMAIWDRLQGPKKTD
jgi:hypothetical protein